MSYGYAAGIDLTRRDLQKQARDEGKPWDLAKGFDQSAPIGAIRPAARIGHPNSGRIALSVNGALRQNGDLADMILDVAGVIAELSRYVALAAGDLIFTGTPEGVGPLLPGDRVRGEHRRRRRGVSRTSPTELAPSRTARGVAYLAFNTARHSDGNADMVIGGQVLLDGLGCSTSSLNHQASEASQPSPVGVGS